MVSQIVLDINKSVDHELQEVKRQLHKAKVDKRVVLQSKGNQHESQLEIEDKIDEALANIKAGKIEKATECLKQGKFIIHKRKKLIRVAGREDWASAIEFRDDDLTSGSEEDKKLRRAFKTTRADRRARLYSRRVEPTPSNYKEPRERSQYQTLTTLTTLYIMHSIVNDKYQSNQTFF